MFLICLITLQSCSVYHSKLVAVDEAIQSERKVKVKTNTNDTYTFKKLQIKDEQLYGITNKNSTTSKKLSEQVVADNINSKEVSIILPDDTFKEIRIKNNSMPTVLSVALPITLGAVGFAALIVYSIDKVTSWDE
ncbi:MAG: hypothetical protein ABFR32_09920 [Bacteroidota bacterium]